MPGQMRQSGPEYSARKQKPRTAPKTDSSSDDQSDDSEDTNSIAVGIYGLASIIIRIQTQGRRELEVSPEALIDIARAHYEEGQFIDKLIEKLKIAAQDFDENNPPMIELNEKEDENAVNNNSKIILAKLNELQKSITDSNGNHPESILELLKESPTPNAKLEQLIYQTIDGFIIDALETIPYPYKAEDIDYLNSNRANISSAISIDDIKSGKKLEKELIPCYYESQGNKEWILININNTHKKVTIYIPSAELSPNLVKEISSASMTGFSKAIVGGAIRPADSGPVINDLISRISNQEDLTEDPFSIYDNAEIVSIRSKDLKLKQVRRNIFGTSDPQTNPIEDGVNKFIKSHSTLHRLQKLKTETPRPEFEQVHNDNIAGIIIFNSDQASNYRQSFTDLSVKNGSDFAKTTNESRFTLENEEKRLAGAFIKSENNNIETIKSGLHSISLAIIQAANDINSQQSDPSKKLKQHDIARALTFAYKKGGLSNSQITQEMRDANGITDLMHDFSARFQEIIGEGGTVFSAQDKKTAFRTKRVGDVFGGSEGISKLVSFFEIESDGAGVFQDQSNEFTIIKPGHFDRFIGTVASKQSTQILSNQQVETPRSSFKPSAPPEKAKERGPRKSSIASSQGDQPCASL